MMLRSFIAIELPTEIQQAISRSTASLQKALPRPLVRWVASQNIHLTLKFLGDVSTANLERLEEALKLEVITYPAFTMSVNKLGAFPSPRRPRVFWIGLEAPSTLLALQRAVEAVAARMGYPLKERPFSPHLTIGRASQNITAAELQKIRTALEENTVGMLGTVQVNAIQVFKSDLQSSGPVYTLMYSLPLKS